MLGTSHYLFQISSRKRNVEYNKQYYIEPDCDFREGKHYWEENWMLVTEVLPMSWMVLLFNLVFFCLSFPFSKMRFFLWLKSHSKAPWLETNLFFIISLLTLTCDTKHPNYDAFNNLLFSSYLVLNAIIIIIFFLHCTS